MFTLNYAGLTACELGLADEARARVRDAFALAQRLNRPSEFAMAETVGISVYAELRDFRRTGEHAARLLQLATEQQLPLYIAMARMCTGWALALEGRPDEGVATPREGVPEFVATGARTALGRTLGRLAETQLAAGAVTEGLETIEAALAVAPEEVMHVPELLRLRGALRAAAGADAETVEASYRDAAAYAHRLGAKLRELQATTNLARHLRAHARAAEARDLLAPLYASFTEGFDIRDLREAKALLDELG